MMLRLVRYKEIVGLGAEEQVLDVSYPIRAERRGRALAFCPAGTDRHYTLCGGGRYHSQMG